MNFFRRAVNKLSVMGFMDFLPDKLFLKIRFWALMRKWPNFKNPKTFNEKLQWLKLYDRNPKYTKMVDKYRVREYIKETIGEEYLIPLLGVWDKAEDIDFDSLPDEFVLKCNHDSGGLIICRDKSNLNIDSVNRFLNERLEKDFYSYTKEWPYKNIEKKIIAEKYMKDDSDITGTNGLIDYKFYCFNGEPRFGYVSQGLENHDTAYISYVTLDWEIAPFKRTDYEDFSILPPKPINYDKMISLSKKLSQNTKFLRVDFYEINERIYFGELTFYPGSGMTIIEPEEWDYKLGDMINL